MQRAPGSSPLQNSGTRKEKGRKNLAALQAFHILMAV
jgi:hypothetical protein